MKKYKISIIVYLILLIIFIFLFSIYFQQSLGDIIWNYSFSHAIRLGEIPYKDFNIISTPLYSFIMSIGLFIYDDILTISIESVIIYILMIYILYKLFKKKILYILPIFILFFILKTFIPTYNLLTILFILLLLLFEKENKSDLSIGVILGLIILSKHTIGFVFAIISLLLVIKDKKRIGKRLIGLLIPCIIFLIYLLLTNSLSSFIDLCILGMFDFASNNKYIIKSNIIVFLIIFIINIILLIKYRRKHSKELFYSLGCISLIIPMLDNYHTYLYIFTSLICILLFILDNIKINNILNKHINIFIISLNIILLVIGYLIIIDYDNKVLLNINHFNYTYMDKNRVNYIKKIHNKYNEYENNMMIGRLSPLMDIASDNKITYYNVLLYGNWGYNIDKKVKEEYNKLHNTYIFIEDKPTNKDGQDYIKIYDYIEKDCIKIDSIYDYTIYYKE